MLVFQWTPDLVSGHELIDMQHQELVKAVNRLSESMWEGRGREETGKVLEFLGNYVVEHFRDEEGLMLQRLYPNYAAHKAIHQKFVEDFQVFAKEFAAGNCSAAFCAQVLAETCDWLRTHIRVTDKEFVKYMNDK
jgi:hemerythrin-like metal-binding protein